MKTKKRLISIVLVLTMVLGLISCGQNKDSLEKEVEEKDKISSYDKEEEADIVVIGGGGAGMATAVAAIEEGADSVILVEKLPVLGGAMRLRSGQFSAPDTKLQREEGLNEDSKEKYKEEIMQYAHLHGGRPIEYIIDTYVENSTEAWDWIYDMGVKDYEFFKDEDGSRAIINRGHMPYKYKRTYVPLAKEGSSIANPVIEVLENKINENKDKIKVYTMTEGRQLVYNDKGQINGVICESKEEKYLFKASKGVVMTTGGYAGNTALFEKYSTDLTNLLTAALPAGDGYG